jgi:hypothetical protein
MASDADADESVIGQLRMRYLKIRKGDRLHHLINNPNWTYLWQISMMDGEGVSPASLT